MPLVIVPLYASLLAVMLIVLSVRVIRLRRAAGVPIGHGGQHALERSMRVQANFAEYVPIALILLSFVEMQDWPWPAIHALCIVLLAGRLTHAFGLAREPEDFRYRVTGMAMTFAVLGISAAMILAGRLLA
ncbi:MAG: MAPEG family protein [Pseudorhodoplanes sp.]|nr:MAPEG family protein [Pseudorhodoplanes sp.]